MGSFFTNVSILNATPDAVAAAMAKLGYEPSADGIALHMPAPRGKWCTLHSDWMDNLPDLPAALANHAEAVLYITCIDSDFMLLTLTHSGHTETVCVGEPYDDEVEIALTPEHWQPYVGDLDAFRAILDEDYVFAEESLVPLGKLFGFEAEEINVYVDELLALPENEVTTLHFTKTAVSPAQSSAERKPSQTSKAPAIDIPAELLKVLQGFAKEFDEPIPENLLNAMKKFSDEFPKKK